MERVRALHHPPGPSSGPALESSLAYRVSYRLASRPGLEVTHSVTSPQTACRAALGSTRLHRAEHSPGGASRPGLLTFEVEGHPTESAANPAVPREDLAAHH